MGKLGFLLFDFKRLISFVFRKDSLRVELRRSPPPCHTLPDHCPIQMQPYLGLKAHLSLAWLSHPLLVVVLLSITLAILLSNITALVSDAKGGILSSCQGVQGAANVLVSLPHYMADGINEMNQKAIDDASSGLAFVLDLALLSVEEIAMYVTRLDSRQASQSYRLILVPPRSDSSSTCISHSSSVCSIYWCTDLLIY